MTRAKDADDSACPFLVCGHTVVTFDWPGESAMARIAMQWCAPSRRQHAGTVDGSMAGAAVASKGQQSARIAMATLSFIPPV